MKRVDKKGFTLVEMVLVIAIVCILLLVVTLSTRSMLSKAEGVNESAAQVKPSLSNKFENERNKD